MKRAESLLKQKVQKKGETNPLVFAFSPTFTVFWMRSCEKNCFFVRESLIDWQ